MTYIPQYRSSNKSLCALARAAAVGRPVLGRGVVSDMAHGSTDLAANWPQVSIQTTDDHHGLAAVSPALVGPMVLEVEVRPRPLLRLALDQSVWRSTRTNPSRLAAGLTPDLLGLSIMLQNHDRSPADALELGGLTIIEEIPFLTHAYLPWFTLTLAYHPTLF